MADISRHAVGRLALLCVLVGLLDCLAVYAPSRPGEPPTFCTAFNHMVKSGGTSIKDHLIVASQRLGNAPPGVCTYGGSYSTPKECEEAVTNSSVIMGYTELLREPLAKMGRSCDHFTMMRHPISRVVSAFFFCPRDQPINRPAKWCGNMQHELPLQERLLEFVRKTAWSRISFRQMMFGISCPEDFEICGKGAEPTKPINNPLSPEGLQALRKMEGLLSSYKAIGIFEHWELSMALFDATITSSVQEWQASGALNPGPSSAERDELLGWAFTSPDIHSALAADIMLYEFSLSVFQRQTRDALGTRWPGLPATAAHHEHLLERGGATLRGSPPTGAKSNA